MIFFCKYFDFLPKDYFDQLQKSEPNSLLFYSGFFLCIHNRRKFSLEKTVSLWIGWDHIVRHCITTPGKW